MKVYLYEIHIVVLLRHNFIPVEKKIDHIDR
jgi:hypothetical protein